MKKFLLAVGMVLVLASPVMAGTVVVIDNAVTPMETVNINDHLYMPLRALGEALGADVQWDGLLVTVKSAKRPSVTGGDALAKTIVFRALDLLKNSDSPDYDLVCKSATVINISSTDLNTPKGEAYARTTGPKTFELSPKLLTKSPEYIAATLVHESCHLCGNAGENIAYLHEITTLKILGASQAEINEIETARQYYVK